MSSAEGLWKREKLTVRCNVFCIVTLSIVIYVDNRGGSRGGVGHRSTQKFEKIWFFGVRSWFFHTKYPKMVCASLRSAQFFKVRPPLTWNRGSAPGQYMCIRWETDQKCSPKTLIGTVIVSVLATSAVDRGFESRSGQTMFCTHPPHSVGNLWFRVLFLQNPNKKCHQECANSFSFELKLI